MSVTTLSDEHLESAKNEIEHAIKSLSKIVIDRDWGWDEFNNDYFKKMNQSLFELVEIRERLGCRDE